MACGCLNWFSVYVTALLLISCILTSYSETGSSNSSSLIWSGSGGDKVLYHGRNSGLSRKYKANQQLSSCSKARSGIYLVKLSMCAGYIVLLSGDVSTNPGPANSAKVQALDCGFCMKAIKKNQPRMLCNKCDLNFHFKCFGPDFEIAGNCRHCCINSTVEECSESVEEYFPSKLYEFVKLRGFKIVHQNVQSLASKIEQLCLLICELKSGLHILALSETWLKSDVSDGEYEIPGYRLFRKDRVGRNGRVGAYVRDDLMVIRRDDLEVRSIECLWLEVHLPKSRSFLVAMLYRPGQTSKYYDKDFTTKGGFPFSGKCRAIDFSRSLSFEMCSLICI